MKVFNPLNDAQQLNIKRSFICFFEELISFKQDKPPTRQLILFYLSGQSLKILSLFYFLSPGIFKRYGAVKY
jgi:hypothetical protein